MKELAVSNTNNQRLNRESGVELLKVIGILLVVLSHVIQTLTTGDASWAIAIKGVGITDISTFIIAVLRYSGALGNYIFFTCSAWYLLDKEKTNYQKVMRMLLDIFVISMAWLIPMLIFKGNELTTEDIVRSIFPSYSNNNWYTTSYILFCFIYPFINLIIKHLDQRKHLIVASTLFIAYFLLGFFDKFPWASKGTYWIVMYFVMAYLRLYGARFCNSKKANIIALVSTIVVHIGFLILSNYIFINSGEWGTMYWNGYNNPLLFIIALTSLNLMKQTRFSSRVINYVSSFSLLIYVIHENLLFRTYLRPLIWEWIYLNLGYDLLFLWIFLFALALFAAAFIVAIIYRYTLEKPIHKLSDWLLSIIKRFVLFMTDLVIKPKETNS